jgi:DNA-binding transcriptional MerR regulator
MPNEPEYTIQDLADVAEVTPRTIRYYVAQGLLPSPEGAGPGSRYSDGHLARLRLIRRLQREHLPLAEIRARIATLDDGAVSALLDSPVERPRLGSAVEYIRSVLGGWPAESEGRARAIADQSPRFAAPPAADRDAPGAPPAPGTPPPFEAFEIAPGLMRRSGPLAADTVPPSIADRSPEGPARGAPDAARAVFSAPPAASPTSPAPTPAPERSQWDRIALSPDVELHVRRPLSRLANKQVELLVAMARQLFEENEP